MRNTVNKIINIFVILIFTMSIPISNAVENLQLNLSSKNTVELGNELIITVQTSKPVDTASFYINYNKDALFA